MLAYTMLLFEPLSKAYLLTYMNYDIEIQPAGVTYQASSDDTLLSAALDSKLFLEHSCRKGECGLCSATLLSGCVTNEHGNQVTSGDILTCCSYPQSHLSLRANFFPELASIACVTLPCKVVSCDFATNDIVILKLRFPLVSTFHYLPGQYIDLTYNGVRRSYSVASIQNGSGTIELHIRLIPDGQFSQLLLDGCEPGTLMRIEGPKGTFFMRKENHPIIFLAGGTGFAPIKAMVEEELLKVNSDRNIYIYWGMPTSQSFYTDIAKSWAKDNARVHYIPVVSSDDNTWTGRKGLVHQAVLEDFSNLRDYHVYTCGSPLMINTAREEFVSQGLNKEHFYADIFVSSN